jgi:hypothetical protein
LEQLREFTSEERALRVVSALRFASAVVQEEVAGEPVSTPDAVCRLVAGRLRCADREMLLVMCPRNNIAYRMISGLTRQYVESRCLD